MVPLVGGLRKLQPVVALEPNQRSSERLCQHLWPAGFADAGFAFDKQRSGKAAKPKQHCPKAHIRDVALAGQKL